MYRPQRTRLRRSRHLLTKSDKNLMLLAFLAALLSMSGGSTTRADIFGWEPNPLNSNWDFAGNWSGTPNEVPDGDDDAAIVVGATADDPTLTANRTVGSLSITAGGQVHTGNGTNNYKLAVRDTGPLSGTTAIDGPLSWLTVENSPLVDDFDTENLMLGPFSSLFINDGAKARVRNTLEIGSNALVSGQGVLEINNGGPPIKNDGTIQAAGGTLTVAGTSAFVHLDWDGDTEAGSLRAFDNSTLNLNVLPFGPFNGTMTIDQNAEMHMAASWELGPGGVLNFDGAGGTATLSGDAVDTATLSAEVNVLSGTAIIGTPTNVGPGAELNIGNGATLQFDAPMTIADPSIVNNGGNRLGELDRQRRCERGQRHR